MIHKTFEKFIGVSDDPRIGRKNLLPFFRLEKIIGQIDLYKICNRIYAVRIEDMAIRALLFMRYQEYYEGYSSSIRGQRFSIDQYIKWYMDHTKNKELFTYAEDWAGFNIPSTSLEECLSKVSEKDENGYDKIMSDIVGTIRTDTTGTFYLLGVDEIESDLLNHEMAHGMYFTNPTYKSEMDQNISQLSKRALSSISSKISEMGYAENVIMDEIQAYMSTGLDETMEDIPGIKYQLPKFRKVFKKFLKESYRPQKIEILWTN